MLLRMADAAGHPVTLSESRLLAMSLLAFAGFLQFDELAGLRCCDVHIHRNHLTLSIVSSKTDQFRQGNSIVIARSESPSICPVGRLEQYIELADIDLRSSERLFKAITKTKAGEKLRKSGTVSYTRVRELILRRFQELGYDPERFGLHSFRSGGATLAANAGIPDRLFKRHGRWRSENAKDGYVKDSLLARLEVMKGLCMERK